jgi:hypothetical protein
MILILVLILFHLADASCGVSGLFSTKMLRGGLVPQASDGDYYENFKIDYGCDDRRRSAGSLRGLIRERSLLTLPESDRFLRWIYAKLEKGPQPPSGRVKPFYVGHLVD